MGIEFTENDLKSILSSNIFDSVCNCQTDMWYFELSKISEGLNAQEIAVIRLVHDIMTLMLTDVDSAPYGPLYRYQNSRSFAVEDITEELANMLFANLDNIVNPVVKSRIADVLWVRRLPKGELFKCATTAINGYYETLGVSLQNRKLHIAKDIISRLNNLSLKLKGSKEQKRWFVELPKLLQLKFDKDDDACFFFWYHLLNKIVSIQWDSSNQQVLQDAKQKNDEILNIALERHDYHWARRFYEIEVQILRQQKKSESCINECKKKSAQTYVLQAEDCTDGFNKASFLTDAIKCYMRIPGCQAEVNSLVRKKEVLHKAAVMIKSTFEQEIPPEYMDIATVVKGKILPHAIYNLTMLIIEHVIVPSNPERLKEHATKHVPLLYRIASVVSLNAMGNVIKTYNTEEEALKKQMLDYMLIQNAIAMALVEEAINIINSEHFYSLVDIINLVKDSPFVPYTHIVMMARGMEAFLRDDMMLAAQLLILPFEDCLRNLLFLRAATTKTNQDGSEENIVTIESLIEDCVKEGVLDETFAYFFKAYLTDRDTNFRNLIAHGLLEDVGYKNQMLRTLCAGIIVMIFYVQSIEYLKKTGTV